MNKLYILLISIVGEIIKFFYRIRIPHLSETIKYKSDCEERVIVSLTSYGRRVGSVLPFALYSLLRQTYKPNMIVLWLDNNNWSPENLPKKLKELEKAGLLVVNYCTDIRSYKKLVPSLQAFPNDIIITVDDENGVALYNADGELEQSYSSSFDGTVYDGYIAGRLVRSGDEYLVKLGTYKPV